METEIGVYSKVHLRRNFLSIFPHSKNRDRYFDRFEDLRYETPLIFDVEEIVYKYIRKGHGRKIQYTSIGLCVSNCLGDKLDFDEEESLRRIFTAILATNEDGFNECVRGTLEELFTEICVDASPIIQFLQVLGRIPTVGKITEQQFRDWMEGVQPSHSENKPIYYFDAISDIMKTLN
jgi:hypothetical protein